MPSLLAALLLWSTLQSSSNDIAEISAAIRARDYPTALERARAALQSAPRDARLWTLFGIAEAGSGDTGKALEAYRHALTESPVYLPALKGKAEIEYNARSPEAAGTLIKILAQRPRDEVSNAMLAAVEFQARHFESARSHFEAGYEAIRSEPVALTEYAQCLLETRHNQDAIQILKQAAALKPGNWTGAYNFALASLLINRPADAVAELQPWVATEHPAPAMLDLASVAYEATGDTPQAVAVLRRAIVAHPEDVDLYLHFADLCFVHRSFQAGVDMLSAGLIRLPDSARLYVTRGILWAQLGKYDKADADFDRAEKLDPSGSYSALAQGVAQLQTANFDQALATTEAQLKKTPNDAFLHYLEAEALNNKGLDANSPELAKAIDAAKQAVRLRPDFPLAEDLLGNLYRKQGKSELARKQFQDALVHDPANQTALYQLILLERAAGHTGKVRELLQRLGEAKTKAQAEAIQSSRYQLVTR